MEGYLSAILDTDFRGDSDTPSRAMDCVIYEFVHLGDTSSPFPGTPAYSQDVSALGAVFARLDSLGVRYQVSGEHCCKGHRYFAQVHDLETVESHHSLAHAVCLAVSRYYFDEIAQSGREILQDWEGLLDSLFDGGGTPDEQVLFMRAVGHSLDRLARQAVHKDWVG